MSDREFILAEEKLVMLSEKYNQLKKRVDELSDENKKYRDHCPSIHGIDDDSRGYFLYTRAVGSYLDNEVKGDNHLSHVQRLLKPFDLAWKVKGNQEESRKIYEEMEVIRKKVKEICALLRTATSYPFKREWESE
jgi:cell shape-determining protein MreC